MFITEELNVPRSGKNLILSNLQGIPLNLFRNKSASFRKKVEAVIHLHDVVFCDHYVMFQYVPDHYKGKVVLHEHNCEYLIWQRYAEIEKGLFKKAALLNQARHIRQYERYICSQSDAILAAPNDTDELVRIGAHRDKFYETYHLGDDHLLDEPALKFDETELSLLYVGTLSWEANVDGLVWFIRNSWKSLKATYPDIKLYIIGKNPDARLKDLAAEDTAIHLEGFVADLEPYFRKCRVFITPLRFGSGIKVKVVNALYRGIPCVTTSIGTEGLKVRNGEHLFIKDESEDFTSAVQTLLNNEAVWKKLSSTARVLARQYYTWENVLENIRLAIEES
jgi:glycosyltransferase involved in cell wall biosynthesis